MLLLRLPQGLQQMHRTAGLPLARMTDPRDWLKFWVGRQAPDEARKSRYVSERWHRAGHDSLLGGGRRPRWRRHLSPSLRLYALSGIADRDVIAFWIHFEVALVKSDDCRAVTDGHYRRLRQPPGQCGVKLSL